VTNKEILRAIRDCARKLGRVPTINELRQITGMTQDKIAMRFGSMGQAIHAAGLEPIGAGHIVRREALLKDWAEVARKLKRLPTSLEYLKEGRYSLTPIYRLWRLWRDVEKAFREFVKSGDLDGEWQDVLALVDAKYPLKEGRIGETAGEAGENAPENGNIRVDKTKVDKPVAGRPVYGERLDLPGLARAPMNEDGVLLLFGMMAHILGFDIQRVQREFPDCEAMREVSPGKWQVKLIELEFESRNFAQHKHDPAGCDMIVCWRHNWAECPPHLEVIELRKEVWRLRGKQLAIGN